MKTQVTILACMLLMCSVSPTVNAEQKDANTQFIAADSMLTGLAPGALFPFIDTTPRSIVRAHVAVTDATSECHPGAAPPANVAVLAGQAGATLVSVMTAATNTGIGSKEQCVFHVTITAGESGIPEQVTDIVVVNTNKSDALTGVNTVTASADVH